MKYTPLLFTLLLFTLLLAFIASPATLQAQTSARRQPNIIFILTDDLGYGDLGVFFQNQRQKTDDSSEPWHYTPNLDKLAASGAQLTQQYCNAPVCAPSRASLLTGVNQGNAHVRDNQFDKALEDNHTLGTVLQTAGYTTAAIGKWGLQGVDEAGPDWPAHPLKRGFDAYFGYMRHVDGHEHYPVEGVYRGPKQVWYNYENVADAMDKCYTTDLWTAAAKKYITDHEQGADATKPFFLYLAYDAPHAVLELPTQAYPAGQGLKGGLLWLGSPGHMINTASGEVDSYVHPDYQNATYDDDRNPATPQVPWPDTYKRYATAVRRIDDGVGDLMQLLKDLRIDENTLVVFTSDNGPSIESYLPVPYVPNYPTFFNSFGPFDGIKRDTWEGGLRMPTLVAWPVRIPAGKVVTSPSIFSDWMATMAEAAQMPAPARTDGVSLLPSLTGKGRQPESLVYVEYFHAGETPDFEEFGESKRNRRRDQMQMLRLGNLVGVRYQITSASDDFEIYDVVKDPAQRVNLALQPGYEQVQEQLKAKVLQVRRSNATAGRPYDNALIPAVPASGKTAQGLAWKYVQGDFPWVAAESGQKASAHGTAKAVGGKELRKKKGMVYYEGYVQVPADGVYEFSLTTTGKAFVRLHEAILLDADFGYAAGSGLTQRVPLKAGLHPIKIAYLSGKGAVSALTLQWKKAGEAAWHPLRIADLRH
ncbi:sulfatase-like hydrolase/transferase [Pontibacter sp. 172403-2]|uniref:sulfatase-like hydrolase/transferase n=1 Tax=Pontibacter rufus TaxID=2791028 RepID=UPI0018AF8283|nr:sulfatase-like hydrolase/transferase [Pontibacter sp. 172403-2]MBF9252706.1 sulfatase-like hydrolase/transferase [Pontibacter sp. 172403-2]